MKTLLRFSAIAALLSLSMTALAQTPIVPFPPLLTAMPGTLAFDLKEKLADYIKARVVPVN